MTRLATASNCVHIHEGVSAREFDGEWVLLDLRGGNYFGLDEVGGIVWRGLCAGESPAQIARRLALSYEVKETTLLSDVLTFVNELVERGLVRVEE